MVGKLPNCSQARRSRTEERKRDLWIRQSPPEVKAELCPGTESQRCKRGLDVRNQILLADRKKYLFLDIPFYRTFPTLQRRRCFHPFGFARQINKWFFPRLSIEGEFPFPNSWPGYGCDILSTRLELDFARSHAHCKWLRIFHNPDLAL